MKKMTKKATIIVVGSVILLAFLIGVIVRITMKHKGAEQKVYVESIDKIMNLQFDNGRIQRFSGVVETQKQIEIQPETERTIKEIFVSEGDQVSTDTVLFVYDTDQESDKLAKLQLELDRIDSVIQNKSEEISQLEKEKNSVSKEAQLDYTTQIQSAQIELKQNQIDRKAKEVEITNLQAAMENAEVKSTIEGIVKQINKDNTSESSVFMTIISMGDYRIKGKISEQNIGDLSADQKVIVRSRINPEAVWNGTVSEINVQSPVNKNADMGSGDTQTQSSSYNFYVNLDSSEDLMLGQHVYVESDQGQQLKKEGIWLDETYLVIEGEKAYVWADNGKGEIEKKEIVLGQYNEKLYQYEITEGIVIEDKITLPNANLKKGMKTMDMTGEGSI